MTAKLKFTKEEVLAAYSGDASIKQAARTLGCSFMPLVKLMREYGIAAKPKWRNCKRESAIPQLNDRDWLYEQIVKQGRTQNAVAAELGTTSGNVAWYCRKHELYPRRPQSEAAKASYQARYPNGRRGPETPNWRGGRTRNGSGYIVIYLPNHPHASKRGYVLEHRYVMEQKLGRLLKPREVVDHIDLDRRNNHPDNLRLHESKSAHIKDHFNARNEMNELRKKLTDLEAENKRLREHLEPTEGWPTRAEALKAD